MKFRIFLLLSMLVCSPLTQAAPSDLDELREVNKAEWRLMKNDVRQKIKVWVKNEDGQRIRSFKIEAVIDAPVEALIRLGADVPALNKWYFLTREAKILKVISPNEAITYLEHDSPLGVPDRDAIIRMTTFPMSAKQPYYAFKWQAMPDYIPHRPSFVRMLANDFNAKFTPLNKNQTLVEAEGFFNPSGHDPIWAINFMQTRAPYQSMLGYRRILLSPKYHDPAQPLTFQADKN